MEAISASIVEENIHKKESQFLELRKQLKQYFRQELRKESGYLCGSSQENRKLSCANYGSFFGQSQASIAERIMENKVIAQYQQSVASRRINSNAASKAKHDMTVCRPTASELKASRNYFSVLFEDGPETLTSVSATMGKDSGKHVAARKGTSESERKRLVLNQLHSSIDKVPSQPKIAYRNSLKPCSEEVMAKHVKSTKKYETTDGENQKASSSRSLIVRKRKSEEKLDCLEVKKAKVMQNKLQSSSKVQASNVHKGSMSKSQSLTKKQSEQSKELHRPNKIKRPTREPSYQDNVDMTYVSSLCQNLFRRNPTKQAQDGRGLDGDCMVSSFSDIQKEERKSAKLAGKEDRIEQLRLEREEKLAKLRRQAKKQKPNQT